MENNASVLFVQIRALGAAVDAFERAASRALDINRSDLHALNALEYGPLSHRDLAERLDLSSGTVTTLVDRLVAAGYVERQPDPGDRRRIGVALTAATYQAFARVYRPCGQAVAASTSDLSDEARQVAADALERAADAISAAARELGVSRDG
ncbi:MAG: MarR family transcriptional regulator [Actinomycetota bacterium]